MQLSETTVQVLKNFSGINPSIVINEGNELKTMAEARNLYAIAKIRDTFADKIGIYDLNEFLRVLELVEDPNLDITSDFATVNGSGGLSKVKYYFTDPDMITTPPNAPKLPAEWEVQFELNAATINRIKSAGGALGHKQICVSPADGSIRITVCDPENKTSNTFSMDVAGTYKEEPFEFYLTIDNLKCILPGSYGVNISSRLVSKFVSTNADLPLEYVIALEKNSKYGV